MEITNFSGWSQVAINDDYAFKLDFAVVDGGQIAYDVATGTTFFLPIAPNYDYRLIEVIAEIIAPRYIKKINELRNKYAKRR